MSDLATLETEAKQLLATVTENWNAFCHTVETIKDSGLWRVKSHTWGAYCKQVFGVTDSRIRQHLNASELSDAITAINGVPLTSERQARSLSEFAETVEDKAIIHKLATAAAQTLDVPVTRSVYAAVVEAIEETIATNGNVSIDEDQLPATVPNALHLSIVNKTQEALNRAKEHRTQGLQDAPVVVMQIGDKAYPVLVLPNDYPVHLLQNWIAKVPKAERKDAIA